METVTDNAVLAALRQRRSTARVRPEPPPRELIEQIIQAALYAPNHYRTEPWRFIVIGGAARVQLGDVMAGSLAQRLGGRDDPEARALIERERSKPLRAPVVIAVGVVPSTLAKVREIEEIAAGAAAVEHMLLAAQALGLGAMWRTGEPAYDPAVKAFLGLPPNAHLLSFVYIGYPDMPALPERPRDAAKHTLWLGGDSES